MSQKHDKTLSSINEKDSSAVGLTAKQAKNNLDKYGLNVIEEGKKKSLVVLFFEQFANFLVILLLFAAVFSLVLGEIIEGSLIMTIVILNALFGVYQEKKAEQAIAALKDMTATMVRVIRGGKEINLDSKYLVPGDLIKIEEGNKIPADGKVITHMHLQINESALTGESYPVNKNPDDEVFAGTIVSKGRAQVKILKTGMKTKFGEIAANLAQVEESKTPLQKKMASLTKILGMFGIVSSFMVFLLSYFLSGDPFFPAMLLAVSTAVAVVPEGLPAVMTVTMAIGVKNMAKKKAIIRNLASIEALGNITLIATDKTGTLTTNVMRVKETWLNNKVLAEKNILSTYKSKDENFTELNQLVIDGVMCSTAALSYDEEKQRQTVIGDPTEGALLYLAEDMQEHIETLRSRYELLEELPFDSVTKRMSVKVKKDDQEMVYTKGAPEAILQICSSISLQGKVESLTDEKKREINKVLQNWATKGLRVLAFSMKKDVVGTNTEIEKDQVFLGMVAIHDAPRPEAKEAVQKAKIAGIRSVMITGDNEKTAEAVGRFVGVYSDGDKILTGEEIDKLNDVDLKKLLSKVTVFARTTPFHKSRLVKLYQELGEIVASTGDGVNDAIALKQADVGVAMGLVGTDVTREAADMVITDDNFKTIVNAVEEGRNIIRSIRNVIKHLLSTNLIEVCFLIVGLLLGIPHMLNALILLFINLITDGVPALTLAFAPHAKNIMNKKMPKKIELLRKKDFIYIVNVAIIGLIIFFIMYFFPLSEDKGQQRMVVFSVLVMMQTFVYLDIWISHRFLVRSVGLLFSWYFAVAFFFSIGMQFLVATVPLFANIFKAEAIPVSMFMICIFYSFLTLVFLEFLKPVRKLF